MPLFTNVKIKNFCNEQLRRAADAQATAMLTTRRMLENANADLILTELDGVDDNDVIDDGSLSDGRSPLTVGMLKAYLTNSEAAMADATAEIPGAPGVTRLSQILYVAVNEKSLIG
jgi:hypothetical protein